MDSNLAQSILQQVKDNYNICAKEFSLTRSYNWQILKTLADKYVKNGMRILDAGCGNGRVLELLADIEVAYIGIDNSEKLIEKAKRRGQSHGEISSYPPLRRGEVDFITGDVLDMTRFEENKFDIVMCIAVLHHIPSKELRKRAMSEIYRVIKPRGILIMTNWNLWQDKYRKYIYTKQHKKENETARKFIKMGEKKNQVTQEIEQMDFGDIMLPPFSGKGEPRYHHAFTKLEIKKLFKQTGFQIKECYYEKKGKKACWRDGANLICVGEK